MNKKKATANILLLVTAIIWGSAIVAQRVGMDYVGPLTFGASRFFLATLILIPVMKFMNKGKKATLAEKTAEETAQSEKYTLRGGIICGIILFCGSTLQQIGLIFTPAGKAGFITALYIVLIPIFSLVLKKRPELRSWIGVVFGAAGLYLLCIKESFTIAQGDLVVLVGACFWAAHLLAVDHFLPKVFDAVKLSFIQFAVCTGLSAIGAFIFETITLESLILCAIPILYAGILSGGVGYTLQIVGQRHTNPTVASLILSLEAVFSAVFGYLLLKELLTTREILGCVLMFIAIIISQLPDKKNKSIVKMKE